ncbi:hypothetical protein HK103_004233 [Boothiomyces macroporosus]|uniref:HNH nuclease domain-containing protein n=1 Tax=Boothiomyces macroporosus TaxID=261099 RepID=A0AAD5Y400_9FUNG|nr:hypothetical protein HK103_004233 [Boothiomyces macroporosus]
MNDIRSNTRRKLKERCSELNEHIIPEQKIKSQFDMPNKLGLLLGVIAYGIEEHVLELSSLLDNDVETFEKQLEFSTKLQILDVQHSLTFIDRMFNFYIATFHQKYSDAESCRTSRQNSVSSRPSSAESIAGEPTHNSLSSGVKKRDVVCLFCWNTIELHTSHIIAQKNANPLSDDENSVLTRCGLQNKHQIQNGLLLCSVCHGQFDKLKRYVDGVDGMLVVKVVNEANDNDVTSEKYEEWELKVDSIRVVRGAMKKKFPDRQATLDNGEMPLYFVDNNAAIQPSRAALAFHKTACLIWRMAGGAEPQDEECSDDEELGPVNTAELKRRFNIHESTDTLYS